MLIHAARESSIGLPHNPHEFAIALQCENEDELEELCAGLDYTDIEHIRFIENDAPWTGQLMAIGIRPGPRSKISPHLKNLKALR